MAIKVCLDAGHYGKYNRSPAVSSYYESDIPEKSIQQIEKEQMARLKAKAKNGKLMLDE